MNIFFDTEFTGLQKDTTLISIGLVSGDSSTSFYAEFTDYDESQCNQWIYENVIKNLKFNNRDSFSPENSSEHYADYIYGDVTVMKGNKEEVKEGLLAWLNKFDTVELISDVCHYDMVLFIDIFGGAFDLPTKISSCCYELNQDIASFYSISTMRAFDMSREDILISFLSSISGDKHNSLYDAAVIREIYRHINMMKNTQIY